MKKQTLLGAIALTTLAVGAAGAANAQQYTVVSTKVGVSTVSAAATVTLKDGRRISHRIEHCMGSHERPMTDAKLDEKFRGQARLVLPEKKVEALMQQCWHLTELDKVGDLATQFFHAE